jgi:phosphohistidine phosphatase
MQLHLVRHGLAEDAAGGPDEQRALTRKGRERFEREVAALGRVGVRFDRLYHSPMLRAVQTAELLAPLLDGESVVTPLLAEPPGPELLASLQGERVALVGHQPWLGELLSVLLVGTPEHGGAFELRKGAVVWLEGDPVPAGMTLRALHPPALLRALV